VAYATDSAGRLYSANFNAGQVRAFTTVSGVPAAVAGNPFTSGLTEAVHGVLHAGGFYMVADRTGNRVGVFQVGGSGAATTLTAVAGSPFAAGGTFTDALALNPAGTYLYAANGSSRNITMFTVNPATGILSTPLTQPANTLGAAGNITGMARTP
jgi:6-phosphogluconolactonase (cycloisomerase 2 family)